MESRRSLPELAHVFAFEQRIVVARIGRARPRKQRLGDVSRALKAHLAEQLARQRRQRGDALEHGGRRDLGGHSRDSLPLGESPLAIAAQIRAIQESAGDAVEAIRRIAGRMKEIDNHTSSIATSVAQQSAATSVISQSVSSAAHGARSVASVLEQVTRAVTSASGSAKTVLTASQAVEDATGHMRTHVGMFLRRVAV